MKTDDVRSGTRDMVPSFPGFFLFLPRERRKRKNPGNEVDQIGARDVSQFAGLHLPFYYKIFTLLTKSYKTSFRASGPLFTFTSRKEKMKCP